MKLTTGILILGMAAGTAWGQNPDVIENTRNTLKAVGQKQTIDSNTALAASQGQAAKPSAPATHPVTASGPGQAAPAATASAAAKPKVTPAKHSMSGKKTTTISVGKTATSQPAVAVEDQKANDDKKPENKAYNLTSRRDPFVSPVSNRAMVGSGCSTGKKCLAIDQISLRGIVKSDTGMIAVVVNALEKAYFLHENDPVFNGYVVKITGDSIIFKETVQDRLGKPFTREVTKKITNPAA